MVFDHMLDRQGWSVITSAAEAAGALAIELRGDPGDYVEKPVPGVCMKLAMIAKVLDKTDVLNNMPVLKTHHSWHGSVTVSLKNHLGSVLDRSAVHDAKGYGLQQGIADLNICPTIRQKHRLTICDGLNPMVTGGPKDCTYAEYNLVLAGADPVATDFMGTMIIRRYSPAFPDPNHIGRAADPGLSMNDPSMIVFNEHGVFEAMPESMFPMAIVGLAAIYLSVKARYRFTDPSDEDHLGESQ